jgi:hypothetical protein
MFQTSTQAVDFKVGRHFGEKQVSKPQTHLILAQVSNSPWTACCKAANASRLCWRIIFWAVQVVITTLANVDIALGHPAVQDQTY